MLSAQKIKDIALSVGFAHCGIARAHPLDAARQHFQQSLEERRHADMAFLERDVDKRFDPSLLLPNCQSVVVVAYNYYIDVQPASNKYRTARYTWMEDYHTLLKPMLEQMVASMQQMENCQCRITVDSSCISEKNWAVEAGVGCYGKNGLIHNEDGSFFVLATILTDVAFDSYDSVRNSDCGECHICEDKCPAHALDTPYCVDASQCFAYHTIENKNPDNEMLASAPLLFGCDVCQEVCPKNLKNKRAALDMPKTSLFLPLQNEQFESLSKEDFKRYFGHTAIARRKYDRFYNAIQIRKKESQ